MSFRRFVTVFTLLVAIFASACSKDTPTAATPPPPAATTATLSGTITDATSGTPLAGATVTIGDSANLNRTATSDANGSYRLQNLAVSGFTFRVEREGYDGFSQGVNLTADSTVNVQLSRTRLALTGSNWRGTFTASVNGNQGTTNVPTATVSHNGTAVTGTFTTSSWQGNFTGTLSSEFQDARISGTLQTSAPSVSRTVICNSAGTFTGTVFPSITITAPVLVSQNCAGTISNVNLALTR